MRDVIEIRWAFLEPERDEPRNAGQVKNSRQPLSARVRQGHRLSALGKKLLADILLDHYGIDLTRETDPIARHPLGKPYLTAHEDLYFSISHSADWAACAVGPVPMGLDIQYRKKKKTDLLAARILSGEEFSVLENAPDRDICFYDFWVKKESYLKYTGEGIRKDLRTVPYEDCRFLFLPGMIDGCAAALCVPACWNGTVHISQNASGNE